MSSNQRNIMTENDNQTFLTALPDEKQLQSILINDDEDDIDIDVKSSADSQDTPIVNDEIEGILNKKESQEFSSVVMPNITDALQDKMSHDDPSPSAVGDHLPTIIPRAVYDYAAMVHETFEGPRQNKLDEDVNAILGSNDPPPGFGFLHPRFYYLEQKRPVPMEPLRVWRGYNGHVYFSPIQVQQLETDRVISPTKARKSTAIRTVLSSGKIPERSCTILSAYRNKKSSTSKDRTNNDRSFASQKANARTAYNETELKNNTLATFTEGEENKEQSSEKMWRSVVTCIPVQIKPMSKRSQYAIEDLQELQQEQLVQDSTGYNRQVLPNIRPIPKSKFVYKGLAYKEVTKIPGIKNENDEKNSAGSLKKPLIDYNLAQAYIRYEVNAARAQQTLRQPPLPPTTTPATLIGKDQRFTKIQTPLDLREMRKRIIKGTTFAYRPTPQSASWGPGRTHNKSILDSENLYGRPLTSKSSIPLKQTTVLDMPILTRYVTRPRSISRHTPPTSEIVANAS